ncbi:MAG: hypothetical protein R2788_21710 [Saprospiraceae bacterium]
MKESYFPCRFLCWALPSLQRNHFTSGAQRANATLATPTPCELSDVGGGVYELVTDFGGGAVGFNEFKIQTPGGCLVFRMPMLGSITWAAM